MFLQFTVGGKLSCTVTTEVHVLVAPQASVTVRVTKLGPTSSQSNIVCEALKVIACPHISALPLFRSDGSMVTWPLTSNCTVMFLQTATGGILNITKVYVQL